MKKRIMSFAAAVAVAFTMGTASLPAAAANAYSVQSSIGATVVTVKFDPDGGTCSKSTMRVSYGYPYGALPTPKKTGYTFLGWYTKDNKKVTSSTSCSTASAHTLYAHWKKDKVVTCTLKFNGNGGNVSSKSKKYTSGKAIGSLPVARKSGYVFKGWYTKKSGGTRITYNTVLKSVKDRTFYAQYSRPSQATLKWRFSNSYEGFDYDTSYTIPYSIYKYMYGSDAYSIYSYYGDEWVGNCFGMSVSSSFMNYGKVKPQSFNKKVYFAKDLKLSDKNSSLGLNVNQFIECLQVMQFEDSIQADLNNHYNDVALLVKKVKACQSGKGTPVVIALQNLFSGHAVVGYKWKNVSSTEERIYIYDPNYPEKSNCYIKLTKRNGIYTDIEYDDYHNKGIFGGDMTYVSFSKLWNVWNGRANTSKYSSMAINAQNADIYTAEGICCARIVDGEFESYSDNIFLGKLFDSNREDMLIYLPDGDYTVVNKDDTEIEVAYLGGDTLYDVTADSSTVAFTPDSDNSVVIAASEGDSYEVVVSTEEYELTESGCAETDGTLMVSESSADFVADDAGYEVYNSEEEISAVTELDSSSAA